MSKDKRQPSQVKRRGGYVAGPHISRKDANEMFGRRDKRKTPRQHSIDEQQ